MIGDINTNAADDELARAILQATSNQEVYDLMKSYMVELPLEERMVALAKIVAQLSAVMRATVRRGLELGIDVLSSARVVYDREVFDEITRDIEPPPEV